MRFREDAFVGEHDQITQVRTRLTLAGPRRERDHGSAMLSRSRYLAPAVQSVRFYREYFKPAQEREIDKDRRRWLVEYQGEEFFDNLDQVLNPALLRYYLEIKAHSWSRRGAEEQTSRITRLLALLDASTEHAVKEEYVDLATVAQECRACSVQPRLREGRAYQNLVVKRHVGDSGATTSPAYGWTLRVDKGLDAARTLGQGLTRRRVPCGNVPSTRTAC